MHKAIHHLHIRKRIHEKHQEFPHPKKSVRMVDNSVVVMGVVSQIFTLPQLIPIWVNKDASGLSLITWTVWFFYIIVLLFYGIVHKSKSITITYSIWVLLYIPIIVGIFLYG